MHSCDLWSCEGGATGDECFAIVEKKTKAMQAKKRKVAEGKQQRADARKGRLKSANLLGAKVCSELKSEADINKLKVGEIKAALAFLHVEWDKAAKKSDVAWLLSLEMRQGSVAQAAASSAGPSAACMPEKGFMNLFRGRRNGERRPAAAAARLPMEGRPPSADRSIELRSTLLTRLDSPALVARATRRGRLSARQW